MIRITLELSAGEVAALEVMCRGRQIQITAGTLRSEPEDRALARLLLAARAAEDIAASDARDTP